MEGRVHGGGEDGVAVWVEVEEFGAEAWGGWVSSSRQLLAGSWGVDVVLTVTEVISSSLGTAVMKHVGDGDIAGDAGDGDDMALAGLKHGGEEFFDEEEVRDDVDFEDLFGVFV